MKWSERRTREAVHLGVAMCFAGYYTVVWEHVAGALKYVEYAVPLAGGWPAAGIASADAVALIASAALPALLMAAGWRMLKVPRARGMWFMPAVGFLTLEGLALLVGLLSYGRPSALLIAPSVFAEFVAVPISLLGVVLGCLVLRAFAEPLRTG